MVRLFILLTLIPMLVFAGEQSLIVPWFNVSGRLKVNILAASSIATPTVTATNFISTGTYTKLAAGSYINWGSTTGTSGYGIRDNAGTLQYKHSGGAWSSIMGTLNTYNVDIDAGADTLRGLQVVDSTLWVSYAGGLTPNSSFENLGATLPVGWNVTASGASTAEIDTSGAVGRHCLQFNVVAGASIEVAPSSVIACEPYTSYRISFWYKCEVVDIGQAAFQVRIKDADNKYCTSTGLWSAATSNFMSLATTDFKSYWKFGYKDFRTLNVTSFYLDKILRSGTAGVDYIYYIDEVRIDKIGNPPVEEYLVCADTLKVRATLMQNAVLQANAMAATTFTGALTGNASTATTATFLTQPIENSSLESWASASDCNNWTENGTVARSTDCKYDTYAAEIRSTAADGGLWNTTQIPVIANTNYKLSFWAEGNSGNESFYVRLDNNAGTKWNGTTWTTTDWYPVYGTTLTKDYKLYETTFPSGSYTWVKIARIHRNDATQPDTMRFDNIKIEKVDQPYTKTNIAEETVYYPNDYSVFYSPSSEDTLLFTSGYDATNYKAYLDGRSNAVLSTKQVQKIILPVNFPSTYAELHSNLMTLAYRTVSTNNDYNFLLLTLYEGATARFTSDTLCSASAGVWTSTTITKQSGTISSFTTNDEMRIEVTIGSTSASGVGTGRYVELGELRIRWR